MIENINNIVGLILLMFSCCWGFQGGNRVVRIGGGGW